MATKVQYTYTRKNAEEDIKFLQANGILDAQDVQEVQEALDREGPDAAEQYLTLCAQAVTREVNDWISKHTPEYYPHAANKKMLLEYLQRHELPLTSKNLDLALAALKADQSLKERGLTKAELERICPPIPIRAPEGQRDFLVGTVESFNPDSRKGTIKGRDNGTYKFFRNCFASSIGLNDIRLGTEVTCQTYFNGEKGWVAFDIALYHK